MQPREELGGSNGNPSLAVELEGSKMTTPIRSAENSVRILHALFEWYSEFGGYLTIYVSGKVL